MLQKKVLLTQCVSSQVCIFAAFCILLFSTTSCQLHAQNNELVQFLTERNEKLNSLMISTEKVFENRHKKNAKVFSTFAFHLNFRAYYELDDSQEKKRDAIRIFNGDLTQVAFGPFIEIHDLDSTRSTDSLKFDSLYLNLAGIHVTDPTADVSLENKRKMYSIIETLKRFDFESLDTNDEFGRSVTSLQQLGDGELDSGIRNEFRYRIENEKLVYYRRIRWSKDGQRKSEVSHEGLTYLPKSEVYLPERILFTVFNEGKRRNERKSFQVELRDVNEKFDHSVFELQKIDQGQTIIDFRGGKPRVRQFATTRKALDEAVEYTTGHFIFSKKRNDLVSGMSIFFIVALSLLIYLLFVIRRSFRKAMFVLLLILLSLYDIDALSAQKNNLSGGDDVPASNALTELTNNLNKINSIEYSGTVVGRVSNTPIGVNRIHRRHLKAMDGHRYLEAEHFSNEKENFDLSHALIVSKPGKVSSFDLFNRILQKTETLTTLQTNPKLNYSFFEFYLISSGWLPQKEVGKKNERHCWPCSIFRSYESFSQIYPKPIDTTNPVTGHLKVKLKHKYGESICTLASNFSYMPITIEQQLQVPARHDESEQILSHVVYEFSDYHQFPNQIWMPKNVVRKMFETGNHEPALIANLQIQSLKINHLTVDDFELKQIPPGTVTKNFDSGELEVLAGGFEIMERAIRFGKSRMLNRDPSLKNQQNPIPKNWNRIFSLVGMAVILLFLAAYVFFVCYRHSTNGDGKCNSLSLL